MLKDTLEKLYQSMKKSQPQILAKLDHKDILGVRSPLKWGHRICEIALKLHIVFGF